MTNDLHSTTTRSTKPSRLSDAQRVAMALACQRDDGLIAQPPKLIGPAAAAFVAAMQRNGFAQRSELIPGKPFWDLGGRLEDDVEHEHRFALALTSQGLEAIGVVSDHVDDWQDLSRSSELRTSIAASSPACSSIADNAAFVAAPAAIPALRANSKKALILAALKEPAGASVEELQALTSWLAHTVRAALTRVRQDGFALTREGPDAGGPSRYRIVDPVSINDPDRTASSKHENSTITSTQGDVP